MTTKAENKWQLPHDVSALDVAFSGRVYGTLLPPMSEIPDEFNRSNNRWVKIASSLFFSGGQLPTVKDGIDSAKASRHLQAVLSSFEPAHEHKEAGAAYLMSLWYQEG